MLVLSRKVGEQICIDGNITVTINRIEGNRVSLSFDAPRDVHIVRAELRPFGDGFPAPRTVGTMSKNTAPKNVAAPVRTPVNSERLERLHSLMKSRK
jgi:carbon storage regulator CsrA